MVKENTTYAEPVARAEAAVALIQGILYTFLLDKTSFYLELEMPQGYIIKEETK